MTTELKFHEHARIPFFAGDVVVTLRRVSVQEEAKAPGAAERPRRASVQIMFGSNVLNGHPVEASALSTAIDMARPKSELAEENFRIWFGDDEITIEEPPYASLLVKYRGCKVSFKPGHRALMAQSLKLLGELPVKGES